MRSNGYFKTALALVFVLGVLAPAASGHAAQSGWVVRPNPDEQATEMSRLLATRSSQASSWVVRPNPDQQAPVRASTTIVRVTNPSDGFDWADAGIGAAGGVGLAMIALAGALAITHHRSRRTHGSAGATS